MTTAARPTKKMPLPVEIFYGAMERQLPLADYARNIELHPDLVRQALTGHLQGAHSEPVSALARAMNCDPRQVDLTIPPCDESFGMWLKRNMEGITQHALRARAQLDGQTLKRFLKGDLLPDSDQAERISRALYIDRVEVARVVTASMAAASPAVASQEPAEPGAVGRESSGSTAPSASTLSRQIATGTRPRRASPRSASAEPAPSLSAGAPPAIGETALAAVEPDAATTEDPAMAKKRPRRASKPGVQVPAPIATAMATGQPRDQVASFPAIEAHEAERNAGPVAAAVAAPRDQEPAPMPPSAHPKKSRSRRQPDQAAASGPAAALDSSANLAATEQPPAETQSAADDIRVSGFAAEDGGSRRASSRRKPKASEATPADRSTSCEAPASFAAEAAPSTPDERSADSGTGQAEPAVTAELAAGTTSLQLSPDEVRLLRHWRQLHPHGRRATLQYIGSLLVDD